MSQEKKKGGFWGHDSERKQEVDSEGRTIHYYVCSKCGERLTDYSEYAEKTVEIEFQIYVCTAPFGVLSRDLSGSISGQNSGFLTFNSGSFNGSIHGELEEKYIVKYLDGKLLKTKTFDAETTDIIIDGRFCLTCDKEIRYEKKNGEWVESYTYLRDYDLELHIPELPKLGNTTIEKIPLLTNSGEFLAKTQEEEKQV